MQRKLLIEALTMPEKRTPNKSRIKLPPEHRERIAAAALEQPNLGVRRLSSHLAHEGINVTESQIRKILKEQKLQTRELRLKLLEERHLSEGLALSEPLQRILHDFNPCLRERREDGDQPGLVLILDAVDLGKVKSIGRMFLNVAIDHSCFLTFAELSGPADQAPAAALLNDQALAFYKKEKIAVREVKLGHGVVSGGGVDLRYSEFYKRQSITLTLPLEGDKSLNGFIARFERLVRKEFLATALRAQASWDLETIQSNFGDWLGRFNRQTKLPGYPNMGRAPMEAFEALRPVETAQENNEKIPAPEPDLVSALPMVAIPAAPVSPAPLARKRPEWIPGFSIWGFRALNAALLCLVFYFGWVIASLILDSPQTESDLNVAAVHHPMAAPGKMAREASPLAGYRAIWNRNLFGVHPSPEKGAKREMIEIDKVELAGADVGFKLIGTVVMSDPRLNSAIMEVASTRSQEILREKQWIGKAVVKLILRNTVIIETDDGRRWRLSTSDEVASGPKSGQEALANQAEANNIMADAGTLNVPRDEVPSSPSDVRSVIGDIRLAPQMVEGKLGGVSIGRLNNQNVLSRIGLRTADVIKGMDDMEFASAEDLEVLYERLSRGGDITLLVERRGRLQKLKVTIN
jgi:type II secretory pathway component PulC